MTPPRTCRSTRGEMFFENRSQLLHEVREFVRQASVMSPPRQPLQGLIENDGGEVATKTLPVHRLSCFGLIRFEVRGLQGVPLLPGPLAGAEAHQIEAARTQRRRFPVDHGNLWARVSCAEHDVLSKNWPWITVRGRAPSQSMQSA